MLGNEPGLSECQASALPTELHPQVFFEENGNSVLFIMGPVISWNSRQCEESHRRRPAPAISHSPEGHGQEPLHLDSPLQDFLHQTFVRALLHLFSPD